MIELTKRQRLNLLQSSLKTDRYSFEPHWRELGEYFRPRRTRFYTADRNKGDKRSQKIINDTPVFAARTLAAGMESGLTSPARPWFRLTVPDRTIAERADVKWWLEETRDVIAAALLRSNFYDVLPAFYSDLGVFGTAAMIEEEDDETTIRFTHFPLGGYWLATDMRGRARVFMREFDMTVRQVVEQFGEWKGSTLLSKNLSLSVAAQWMRGEHGAPITVTHIITENQEYAHGRLESKHKKYASCYFEAGQPEDKFLSEEGYDEWPVFAGRWETSAGDVYGTDSPGMTSLGDNKALQKYEKMGAMAIEKGVTPPLVAPVSMMRNVVSQLPGGVSYMDETGDRRVRPLIDTSMIRLDWLNKEKQDIAQRIERAFFVDLFLLISSSDRRDMTATEVMERKEEKLLAVGPVLERLNEDLLDPCIDRTFNICHRRGLIPEAPEALSGMPLRIEYVSIMAQAQKAVAKGGIEQLATFAMSLAQTHPDVLDKVDFDEVIDRYAEALGTAPSMLVDDEKVQAMRAARAQAQQAQQQAEQAKTESEAAANLASADTSGKNALTDLVGAGANTLGPGPSPQGGIF